MNNKHRSPRTVYVRRIVSLEQVDFDTIKRVALERGLGGKGFSAALRLIIKEWQVLQPNQPRRAPDSPFHE
jgi:hypothetical protein